MNVLSFSWCGEAADGTLHHFLIRWTPETRHMVRVQLARWVDNPEVPMSLGNARDLMHNITAGPRGPDIVLF